MFTFALQFVLHLTVLVIAYGRILAVLRRQGKVMPTQCRTITVATKESAAGPSKSTIEMTDNGSTSGTDQRNNSVSEGKAKAGPTSHSQGGQRSSSSLSKARVNVIRTMILIVVCFVICLMPHDFYSLYKTLTVFVYSLILRTYLLSLCIQ